MQKHICKKPIYKILITGDWHCGDKAGLSPPEYWKMAGRHRKLSETLWNLYVKLVTENGPYDMALFTGDMTEGVNNKNTIELFECDTEEQAHIAAECVKIIPCKPENMRCVYGTPFHTAGTYSYENAFAKEVGMPKPKTMQLIDVGGLVKINLKHTAGRSGIPYGQGTPTLKELVNEMLAATRQGDAPANIIVRGHTHISISVRLGLAESIGAPCLKYPQSVFGRKLQDSQYDMGIGVLEIYGKGDWMYRPVLIPLEISNERKWERINEKR